MLPAFGRKDLDDEEEADLFGKHAHRLSGVIQDDFFRFQQAKIVPEVQAMAFVIMHI